MKRMLVNATQPDELRVAITNDSLLIDLDIERPGVEQKKANIYKGRISSIEPSLGAVFVDYGSERHGFLPLKEISREYFLHHDEIHRDSPDIHKLLKLGQELVIQVDKEERGTKGAALTTFISLAGSYLVLMPNNPRAGGISRRIEGEDRDSLRDSINALNVPEGMGVIIRTAGVGKSTEELEWDLSVLFRYWEAIKQAAVAKPGPYLIHQESDVIIRTIRDYLRQDIGEVIIDEPAAFERALAYINQVRPDFVSRFKLYNDHLPLFSRFGIEQQIESAYQREVQLPSGGSIVIDHTEALITIDINSARATKGSNIEETAYRTNLEAAEEIARQLRIRDIGGLVVIDFIDMTPTRNQRDVENRLRDALRPDRARIQIGRISRFGLLEMSRQRIRSSLGKSVQVTCPRCDGQGTIRGVESLGLSIIHLVQEQAARATNTQLQIQLPVDVATFLLNEKRAILKELEDHTSAEIVIIPNPHMQSPHYHLKQVKLDPGRAISSYKLARVPREDMPSAKKPAPLRQHVEPAIQEFLKPATTSAPRKATSTSLIKRLWDLMLGGEGDKPSKKPAKTETSKKPAVKEQGQPRQQASGSRRKPSGKPRVQKGEHSRSDQQQHSQEQSSDGKSRSRRGSRGGQRRSGGQQGEQRRQGQPRTQDSQPKQTDTQEKPEKDLQQKPVVTERHQDVQQKPEVTKPAPQPRAPEKPATTQAQAEKPATTQVQTAKLAPEVKPVVSEAKPKPEPEPVLPSAKVTKDPNYRGLSSDAPLQQVTTKKAPDEE